MAISLYENNTQEESNRTGVGANSLDLSGGAVFLQSVGNVVSGATAGVRIVGVNNTEKVFASDNESNAQDTVTYVPATANRLYKAAITGGTITVADETKYYDLSDSSTVDGVTESLTTGQVQLVKFISATEGVFQIANA